MLQNYIKLYNYQYIKAVSHLQPMRLADKKSMMAPESWGFECRLMSDQLKEIGDKTP